MSEKQPVITYDEDVMALYVQLTDADVLEAVELGANIYLDLDATGIPVGIEILNLDPVTLATVRTLRGASPIGDGIRSRAA